jgi:hypothetical protein
MTGTIWVGTSWKMNKTLAEALAFADGLKAADAGRHPNVQRFIIPPFTAVREVKARLAGTSVKVGAQNMHWDDAGAWTGEISPVMLRDCNLDLVEIGHSERREFFNETDEAVGKKTAAAVRHGLVPLVCIGETLAERESGQADAVLRRQVEAALAPLSNEEKRAPILIAMSRSGRSASPASRRRWTMPTPATSGSPRWGARRWAGRFRSSTAAASIRETAPNCSANRQSTGSSSGAPPGQWKAISTSSSALRGLWNLPRTTDPGMLGRQFAR